MDIGWPEILIIAVVVFALFGYKKLPDATRSIGRSLRIFKAETKGLSEDERASAIDPAPADPPPGTSTVPPRQTEESEAGSDSRS